MNTTMKTALAHKLEKIRFEACNVIEQMESLVVRIDNKGVEVPIGCELSTDLQKLITQFVTMREIYREMSQPKSEN